jgi:hypothetical protein
LTQTVDKDVTTTTPTSSANPSVVGQLVTFTATVASQFGGTVTGMVEFKDGTAILGKKKLAGGVAALSTSSLSAGSHSITFNYLGNSQLQSSSGSLAQQVNP